MIAIYVRVARWRRAIERDPAVYAYMDRALTPVAGDDEEDTSRLAYKTTGAVASVAHREKGGGSLAPCARGRMIPIPQCRPGQAGRRAA